MDEHGVIEHVGEIGKADELRVLRPDPRQCLVGERDIDSPDDRPGKEDQQEQERWREGT